MSRKATPRVDPARIHPLADGPERKGPVVYWMSRDQRAEDNWALLYAQQEALLRSSPLGVIFCLAPGFLEATGRHYFFMLQGLEQTADDIESCNISFFLLRGDPAKVLPPFVKSCRASLLVTDFDPLKIKVRWREKVAAAAGCPVREVDAHNVVPCRFVSGKQEFAARTLRPKIHKLRDRFLTEMPRLEKHPHAWPARVRGASRDDIRSGRGGARGRAADFGFVPGGKAARACLRAFIAGRLDSYDTARNDPNLDGQSNLSPYLHFGQIAAQRVALAVADTAAAPEARDAFLEELIVRRELADNFCLYNPDYDSTAGFADWAGITLKEHARDRRPYLYTCEQLESAETHDELWNAAQTEMMQRGKMHGYLRMYWGKKILEWTRDPAEAMETALKLNNTYELDGRDPNGYAGVAWCIGGVHDRAWPSRPVFGKIRYMNLNGCRRKFDVEAYVRRVRAI